MIERRFSFVAEYGVTACDGVTALIWLTNRDMLRAICRLSEHRASRVAPGKFRRSPHRAKNDHCSRRRDPRPLATPGLDGEQALQVLADSYFKPDLIILDLNIPKVSGLDLLARSKPTAPVERFPLVDLPHARINRRPNSS